MNPDRQRYVVWMPTTPGWEMAAATDATGEGVALTGGLRAMHELAVAIAATGRKVQVRGWVDHAELHALAQAAGVAPPEMAEEPARPAKGDVVIMPEGQEDPLFFAAVAFSPARAVLLMLGPPGLVGWPFVDGWTRESPIDIDIERVARPEHFTAMAGMGFELWATMPALADRAEAAGVPCGVIGAGRPLSYPDPGSKRYDVVTLANNRWNGLARQVVAGLGPEIACHEIPPGSNSEVLAQLGEARVLVHPVRIEGDSRLGMEARAMGTVPVVLNSNPFSVGLDEESGAVPVESLEQMTAVVADLLAEPDRLLKLRERGITSARRDLDWRRFLERVEAVLSRPRRDDPGREARGVIGERLLWNELAAARRASAEAEELRARIGEREQLRTLLADSEQRSAQMAQLELQISNLAIELEATRGATEAARQEAKELDERLMRSQRVYAAVVSSPSWRLTKPLRVAKRLVSRG